MSSISPASKERNRSAPGIYALVLRLDSTSTTQIGSLGHFSFLPGDYLYFGSARGPGGVHSRVSRHLRGPSGKRRHWHIDWFREIAHPIALIWTHNDRQRECEWATALNPLGSREPAQFGASDCRCAGHLLRLDSPADFEEISSLLQSATASEIFIHLLRHQAVKKWI